MFVFRYKKRQRNKMKTIIITGKNYDGFCSHPGMHSTDTRREYWQQTESREWKECSFNLLEDALISYSTVFDHWFDKSQKADFPNA